MKLVVGVFNFKGLKQVYLTFGQVTFGSNPCVKPWSAILHQNQ